MEFQIKENMRLAPVSRLEPEAVQQAASNLDSFLYEQVQMHFCNVFDIICSVPYPLLD
jgi:hypothetical protein